MIEKLKVTDYSKIKNIEFKYPSLVSEDAEDIIKNRYREILETKEALYSAREVVRELEKSLAKEEEEFRAMTHNCTIEFETYEKEYSTSTSNLFIKGQGNDILGTFGN